MRQGFNVLSALLYLLAFVLLVAAVLNWTVDGRPSAIQGGWILLGLSVAVGMLGLGLQWLAGRPPPPPAPQDTSPTAHFHRERLGPAWTDWLALGAFYALLSPAFFVSVRPLWETALLVFGLGSALTLLVIPALVMARREWVSLELHPAGLVLRTRGGRTRYVPRGALRLVRLGVGQVRGFQFGTLELDLGERRPITLREPMNRPLPQIAHAVATHMAAPMQNAW